MVLFRLVALSVACMAAAWFYLSGGSDFKAGNQGITVFAAVPDQVDQAVLVSQNAPDTTAADFSESDAIVPIAASFVSAKPKLDDENKERLAALFDTNATDSGVIQLVSAEKAAAVTSSTEYRKVSGSRVNMRRGPSTDFEVVDKLLKGAEVEVLDENESGWVKLRTLEGSQIGWMSGKFLVASN